ncbi:GntP family permease [uncultured Paracoccus sp.]|uniref:GntP family permease n=1 Tax=uncultured Paracoccus sp. TaxID=189685 RepID=UPI00261A1967|nr:GntP family permease [uncultured Paracoccus sp.]
MLWLNRRAAAAAANGYGNHPMTSDEAMRHEGHELPPFSIAILPIVAVIVLNVLFTYVILPGLDTSYLAEEAYGGTSIEKVAGIWAIIVSLVISILLTLALNWRRFSNPVETFNSGTMGSLLPIFNAGSEVGYGPFIASLPAFALVRDAVLDAFPTNPLASLALAANALAGITGSASGGLSIALATLGEQFAAIGRDQGISLELMHRVATLASGGLDTLPHNGAVITLLAITGLNHKKSYPNIFVVAVASRHSGPGHDRRDRAGYDGALRGCPDDGAASRPLRHLAKPYRWSKQSTGPRLARSMIT